MAEEVLVFKRDLFPRLPTRGFAADDGLLAEILAAAEFLERGQAEHDPTYKQIIPYSILRFAETVFRYRRTARGKESRLHGLYSIGVGGHINRSDVFPLWASVVPIVEWARDRELQEEFRLDHPAPPHLVGVLNQDVDDVSRVHFGVIYEFWLDRSAVEPNEPAKHVDWGFTPVTDLVANNTAYEGWSRILIEQYLASSGLPGRSE